MNCMYMYIIDVKQLSGYCYTTATFNVQLMAV